MQKEKEMNVQMSESDYKLYLEAVEAKKLADAKKKAEQDRKCYEQLVDEQLESSVRELLHLSARIADVKAKVYDSFHRILAIKAELFGIKEGQRTHMFTDSQSRNRITLGYNVTDSYRDTVDVGIARVMDYLETLAQSEESRKLVRMITRLLSKDSKGSIKPSRVVQLRQLATELNSQELLAGVEIIEQAYQPQLSKQFIRAEVRSDKNEWVSIPLGVTEAGEIIEKATK